jgi:hypothetical protein
MIYLEHIACVGYGLGDPGIGLITRDAGMGSAVYDFVYGYSHDWEKVSTGDERGAAARIECFALRNDEIHQV